MNEADITHMSTKRFDILFRPMLQSIIHITLVNVHKLFRSGNQCHECNGMETCHTEWSGHIWGPIDGDWIIPQRRTEKYIPLTKINSKTEKGLNVLGLGLDVYASRFEYDFSTWKPHKTGPLRVFVVWLRFQRIFCWGRLWSNNWSLQLIKINIENCFNKKTYFFFELLIYDKVMFLYKV